ncbi:Imm21 family immunity protein [Streptomyces sp. NPDC048387]|uniref:Imm21 family immunity protein n=1 Tax=Streptomyces sp. NPDC048387 TaxID=3365542 RepID=UPI003724336C
MVEGPAGPLAVAGAGTHAPLADEPAATSCFPEHRAFLRSLAADCDADPVGAAEAVLADPASPMHVRRWAWASCCPPPGPDGQCRRVRSCCAVGIRGIQLRSTAASLVCPRVVPVVNGDLFVVQASSRGGRVLPEPTARPPRRCVPIRRLGPGR